MNEKIKRAGNIIMILILLTATGGLSITRHYCGQSLMSFSIYSIPQPCCDSGCDKCHNEFSFNKVTDEFTGSSFDSDMSNITVNLIQASSNIDLIGLLPVAPVSTTLTLSKFLDRKTGDFPVSFGNFRC
jgi:hypothetical protein